MNDVTRSLDQFLNQHLDRRTLLEQLLGTSAAVAGVLIADGALSSVTEAAGSPPAAKSDALAATSAVEGDAGKRLLTGQAWDDYCDMLRLTGHYIDKFGGNDITDLDRAEWYRFVTRIARNGMERFMENSERNRPRLIISTWRTSINVTNPDQDHLLAELYPENDYIISGNRGTTPYFIIATWTWPQPADPGARNWAPQGIAGLKEFNPAISRTTAFLSSDNIKFSANGDFEVRLSQREQPGNWLKTSANDTGILIRIVHHERSKEVSPTMRIARVDHVKPVPVSPADVSTGLARSGQVILGNVEQTRAWWQDIFSKRMNMLQFSQQLYLTNGGVADRQFAFGLWRKPLDQALVLEFTPPECDYWIFQLCNIWQENLDDYEEGQGYVTKFTVKPEKDGRVRIIVAEEDPGIGGNWVDSFQHTFGLMGLRFIKTAGAAEVTAHLVSLKDLKAKGWSTLTKKTAIISGEVVP